MLAAMSSGREALTIPFEIIAIASAFLFSVLAGRMLISYRAHLEKVMQDRDDANTVQASHVGDPLRVGGVARFAGIVFGI